jgi:thioredoxin 1
MIMLVLTESNFDAQIKEGVTLVDFWASWCGPCRMQGPILEAVAEKVGEKAKVGKVNVDEAFDLAHRFDIQGIPTLILFKDGELVQRLVGLRQEQELISVIEESLKVPAKSLS